MIAQGGRNGKPVTTPPEIADLPRRYWRLVGFMTLIAALGIVTALTYLRLTGTVLHFHAVLALSLGISGAVILAGVLMALVFISDASGHDEAVRDESVDEDWR